MEHLLCVGDGALQLLVARQMERDPCPKQEIQVIQITAKRLEVTKSDTGRFMRWRKGGLGWPREVLEKVMPKLGLSDGGIQRSRPITWHVSLRYLLLMKRRMATGRVLKNQPASQVRTGEIYVYIYIFGTGALYH